MPRHTIERRRITDIEEWLAWRREDIITASVVAALFGLCPHETVFGLFAKANGAPLPEPKDFIAKQRGLDFEDAVAKNFQRRHPDFRVRKANVYLRHPDYRLGASPDYFLSRFGNAAAGRGVLQCKTVAPFVFKKFWTPERPPTWIILQTLVEMMLSRSSFGVIAALIVDGYRYDFHEYPVERNVGAEKRIYDAVAEFWENVRLGKMPDPDYQRDGALIAAMSPHAIPGSTVDLRHDNMLPELLDERAKVRAQMDKLKARCEEIENEVKAKIGDNETALVNGWNVTCKEIKKKEFTVKATSYRQLRATRDETYEATDDGSESAAA